MDSLYIEAEIDSPEVYFDPETKIFSISGISHPENAKEFYQVIMEWVDEFYEYMKNKKPCKIIVDMNFKYINSSSYKYLRELLIKMANFKNSHFDIEVVWNYQEEDEDLLTEGIVLFELPEINLPYRCVSYR
ncbi:MAG TPA: DUF1987 domain-containing protein [Tenuifilaceae bacterium]|nr:DUF1987 domain-containing protein [Bacteroidales bacterium]HOC35767.1 DUF1987 domain-containing protein [Tenuifilaceae bacterium]HOY72378.1 DUF1987 domain-containing protein [Tenuifilaceae bacterium]HPM89953.1 DUF1987 domain-containing protein [Tenuifilaceae bacterium]HPW27476.1 DUF1987 domain-containing protein [Tenuifilaceae bacterium]